MTVRDVVSSLEVFCQEKFVFNSSVCSGGVVWILEGAAHDVSRLEE